MAFVIFQLGLKRKVFKFNLRDTFKKILDTSKINTLFGSIEVLSTVMRMKNNKEVENLRYYICFDEISEEIQRECDNIEEFEIYDLNSVINYGSELTIDVPKPTSESVFTLIFDSEVKNCSKITHKMMCGPIGSMARRGLILEPSEI